MNDNSGRFDALLPGRWFKRTVLGLGLLGRFLNELLIANIEQARLVLFRPTEVRPRWVRFRSRLQSNTARTVLGTLISLTPGTLTCDVDDTSLLIHALDARSDDEAIARIRERFESVLLRMEML